MTKNGFVQTISTNEIISRFADILMLLLGSWLVCTVMFYLFPSIQGTEGDIDQRTQTFVLSLIMYILFTEGLRKSTELVMRFVRVFAFGLLFSTGIVLIKLIFPALRM